MRPQHEYKHFLKPSVEYLEQCGKLMLDTQDMAAFLGVPVTKARQTDLHRPHSDPRAVWQLSPVECLGTFGVGRGRLPEANRMDQAAGLERLDPVGPSCLLLTCGKPRKHHRPLQFPPGHEPR